MAVCVEKAECPIAAPVAHRAREVETVIERQLIIVDSCPERNFITGIGRAEVRRLPCLRQEGEAVARMACPDSIQAHSVADVAVEKHIHGVPVVETRRKRMASVLIGKSAVGPCKRIGNVSENKYDINMTNRNEREASNFEKNM